MLAEDGFAVLGLIGGVFAEPRLSWLIGGKIKVCSGVVLIKSLEFIIGLRICQACYISSTPPPIIIIPTYGTIDCRIGFTRGTVTKYKLAIVVKGSRLTSTETIVGVNIVGVSTVNWCGGQ